MIQTVSYNYDPVQDRFSTLSSGGWSCNTSNELNSRPSVGNDSFENLMGSSGYLASSFRYIGRAFDTATRLYYYRARYYDPTTGRFLREDPIGFTGGINFYRYAANNPALWLDPFGFCITPWDRLKMFGKGLGNIAVGTTKIATALAAAAAAPETGGLSLGLTYYEGLTGVGNIGAGLAQAFGGVSGDLAKADDVAASITAMTHVSGLGALLATGNLDEAERASNAEDLILIPFEAGVGEALEVPDLLKPRASLPQFPLAKSYDRLNNVKDNFYPAKKHEPGCLCN